MTILGTFDRVWVRGADSFLGRDYSQAATWGFSSAATTATGMSEGGRGEVGVFDPEASLKRGYCLFTSLKLSSPSADFFLKINITCGKEEGTGAPARGMWLRSTPRPVLLSLNKHS